MKVLVLGSSGQTGRLLVAAAATAGHEVTAFARRAQAAPADARALNGDVTNAAAVSEAMAGQDVVIAVITGGKDDPERLTKMAENVVAAMQMHGVTRLIFTSAYGPVATKPYVIASIVRKAFAVAFADQLRADQVVTESSLDWTVVRPTRLTNGRQKRPTVSTELLSRGPWSVSRSTLVQAYLGMLGSGEHKRQIVNLTGGARSTC